MRTERYENNKRSLECLIRSFAVILSSSAHFFLIMSLESAVPSNQHPIHCQCYEITLTAACFRDKISPWCYQFSLMNSSDRKKLFPGIFQRILRRHNSCYGTEDVGCLQTWVLGCSEYLIGILFYNKIIKRFSTRKLVFITIRLNCS